MAFRFLFYFVLLCYIYYIYNIVLYGYYIHQLYNVPDGIESTFSEDFCALYPLYINGLRVVCLLAFCVKNTSMLYYNHGEGRKTPNPAESNEGGRNMQGMPNAAETIERLAREAERLKIENERLKAENAKLKQKAEKAEAQ